MTTLQIRITVSAIPPGFGFSARGFIDSMHRFLKKTCGGSCVGIVTDGVITLEARASSRQEIDSFVSSYGESLRKEKRTVEIVVVENPATPLSEAATAAGEALNVAPTKLTKSYCMKLAEGLFLASNLYGKGFQSIFAESVEGAETREAQWERICSVRADQRACYVFPTEGDYRQWSEQQKAYFQSQSR